MMNAAPVDHSMSIISLVTQASGVVQIVLLILLLFSILSWVIIFAKSSLLYRANKKFKEFESRFWSGIDLNELYHEIPDQAEGAEGLFKSGFKEFNRLLPKTAEKQDVLTGVERTMNIDLAREHERLNKHSSILASIASSSPYIGLFGTVWGIMGSFQSLSFTHQATLATVAPWIAEALVATAMGLFAAIPAVLAYNRFVSSSESLIGRYENFSEEFYNILYRNLHTGRIRRES